MITSTQNAIVKQVIKLRKTNIRKKQDLIVIEGQKEIELAHKAGFVFEKFLFCPELSGDILDLGIEVDQVSLEVFQKISYRDKADGFLVIAKPRYASLSGIKIKKNALIVILESLEKPGNLGAILRTGDACAVDVVIINDQKTDIYNPNVIRASRGAVFTNQVAVASNEETKEWLDKNNVKIYSASYPAKKDYTDMDLKKSTAIVMGTEHEGVSDYWKKNSNAVIKIPMQGSVDSLNVSVSCAVILFEALRQRRGV